MAVSRVSLTSGVSGVDQTDYVTASITPTANRLIFIGIKTLYVSGTAAAPTSVTGNGLTWVKVFEQPSDNAIGIMSVWRAVGPSPSTGAITIAHAATCNECSWDVTEFPGAVITGTSGADAVVQAVGASGASVDALVTLAAFSSAENATYGFLGTGPGTWQAAVTEGAGFTLLSKPSGRHICEFKASNDTTVDTANGVDSRSWGAIGIEIQAAPVSVFIPKVMVI